MGEVGWHPPHMPACTWWTELLNGRSMLLLCMVYLVVASVNDLALVASKVIRWAFAWNRPVLSAVMMVCFAWTWHWQAQWLWVSIHALIHRHALHLPPVICDLRISPRFNQ